MVNNAALHVVGDIELTTMDQFTRVLSVNILGALRVTKAFLPLVKKTKGNSTFTNVLFSHDQSFRIAKLAVLCDL